MQNKVKILLVGDIIGKGARNAFIHYLPTLKCKYNYDIISINGENTTHGRGLNKNHYQSYIDAKIDVITMGNHVLDNPQIFAYINDATNIVVPGNVKYETDVFEEHKKKTILHCGYKINFINVVGMATMKGKLEVENPINYLKTIVKNDKNSIYIVDYHADFTLEKALLAYYFDGVISVIYGTHTHVQTADERILPQGSGFISDVGMCGSVDSIIGFDYETFVNKVKGQGSSKISMREPFMINALYVEIDLDSKKVVTLTRINEKM